MLLRRTILYLPAQLVGPLVQVVSAIVWTYWLTPAPYGVLTFLIASQDLVFLVCISWWTHYTMRYLGGFDAERRARFLVSEPPVLLIASLAQVVTTVLVFGLLRTPITPNLAGATVAYVVTRSLLMHLGERSRTQNRIGVYTIGQAGSSVLGFAFALFGVAMVSPTPEAALYGFALAQAGTLALVWRLLGLGRIGVRPNRAIFTAAFRYGAPLLVAGGLAWLAQNGIRIVVEQVAGTEALGLVAVGWGLGQRLAGTLAMLVIAASFPLAVERLHQGSRDDAYRQLTLGGTFLMALIVPAAVGLCLLAAPFVTLFVAEPFRATTIAVLPFAAAAGAVRNIRMHIADPVFLLIERPRVNTAINIIDVVTVLTGCYIGLVGFGLVGAVAGCLAGATASTIAGFVLARVLGGFRFAWADFLRISVASALMATALLAVPWTALTSSLALRMGLEVALGAVVYSGVLAALFPDLPRMALRRLGLAPAGIPI